MIKQAEELLRNAQEFQQKLRDEKLRNREKSSRWFSWARHVIYDTYPDYFPHGDISFLRMDEKLLRQFEYIEQQYAAGKPADLVKRCRTYVETYNLKRELATLKSSYCSLLDDRLVYVIKQLKALGSLAEKHDQLTAINEELAVKGIETVNDPYLAETETELTSLEEEFRQIKQLYDLYREAFNEVSGETEIEAIQKLKDLMQQFRVLIVQGQQFQGPEQ